MYNFPPWMCMKSEYSILSLLIPGPRTPGNDIDIYLQPLIDEFKLLWYFWVETYDVQEIKIFKCGHILCGLSMTLLHMLWYLVWVQNKSLPALVVTMTIIIDIFNIVGKCVIWIIMFLYPWISNKRYFNGKTEFRPPPPF